MRLTFLIVYYEENYKKAKFALQTTVSVSLSASEVQSSALGWPWLVCFFKVLYQGVGIIGVGIITIHWEWYVRQQEIGWLH